jgi:hypothetical protein
VWLPNCTSHVIVLPSLVVDISRGECDELRQ